MKIIETDKSSIRSGKTRVAAGLLAHLRATGQTAAYSKTFSADGEA